MKDINEMDIDELNELKNHIDMRLEAIGKKGSELEKTPIPDILQKVLDSYQIGVLWTVMDNVANTFIDNLCDNGYIAVINSDSANICNNNKDIIDAGCCRKTKWECLKSVLDDVNEEGLYVDNTSWVSKRVGEHIISDFFEDMKEEAYFVKKEDSGFDER